VVNEPVQPERASQRQEAEQPEHPLDQMVQKDAKRAPRRRGRGDAVEAAIEFLLNLAC
jgi:hypothetical protein